MTDARSSSTAADASQRIAASFHGVRYQVSDVLRSIAFYTPTLTIRAYSVMHFG